MNRFLSNILRPTATLALAVALAAPIALTTRADAQLGRQLPSPVSAAQLEIMLRFAGLPDTTKDAALPLHEAYFERFREFEKREVDPALARPNDSPFDLARSVDEARKEADLRRRVFQRAAQLDDQLADEIAAVLPENESWKSRRIRAALSRRRSAMLAPAFGTMGKSFEYSMRSAPVITQIDPDAANIVNTALEAYEGELTRQLARYAEASFVRIVKAAEIREEMGIGAAPAIPAEGEGEGKGKGEAKGTPPGEEWFAKMREAQHRANEDTAKIATRIRKLHREALDQVMPLVHPDQAMSLRDHLVAALYPMLRSKSEFNTVYAIAKAMNDKAEIDRSKWKAVEDLAAAHDMATRAIVFEMMDAVDKMLEAGAGDGGMVMLFNSDGADEADAQKREKSDRLRNSLESLEESDAATLRATIGIAAPDTKTTAQLGREGIQGALEGAMGQMANVQIAMVGGDGEMVVLSGDDFAGTMGENAMMLGGLGGGGSSIPRPMTREEIDALANKLGFEKDTRPMFDEIVARCAEARNIAEKELAPSAPILSTGDEGGMSVTLTLSGEGGVSIGGGDNTKVIEAIEVAEETMFDELKAVVAADKTDANDAARRARARARLLIGESGMRGVDIVSVIERSDIPNAARAKIATDLKSWDETSVAAIRSMQAEVKDLTRQLDDAFAQATTETTVDDGHGGIQSTRGVSIDGDLSERLEQIENRRSKSRDRVAELNRQTVDTIVAALEGDVAVQKTVRRGFLHAANPSVYKGARDLEPYFTKAEAIAGLTANGKAAVNAVRAEWIEARETRCEEFIDAQEQASKQGGASGAAKEMQQIQNLTRERKKLRDDLEQVEATLFRKLQDVLIVDLGAEKAQALGELPVKKRSSMPSFQFSN
jgi:hypothetical protein